MWQKQLRSGFYKRSGVLMRKWRPAIAPSDEEWQVSHQIIVPKSLRNDVHSLTRSLPLAGLHLGNDSRGAK